MIPKTCLHHGDCLDVLRSLPDASVDAVVTSPPYAQQRKKLYGGIAEKDYPSWTTEWMKALRPALKPAGSVLINIREHVKDGQISDYVHRSRLAQREAGWYETDELIWIKPSAPPVGHRDRPRRSWERILWFSQGSRPYCAPKTCGPSRMALGGEAFSQWLMGKGSAGVAIEKSRCRDYVEIGVGCNTSTGHPAAYPVALPQWLLSFVAPPGGTVLDPFMGSGTTGVAAVKGGFNFIGVERAAQYFQISQARIAAAQDSEV